MQQIRSYVIDLTGIRGRGDFNCPKCGINISPEDKTVNSYTLLEPVTKANRLERLILQCNKCGSQIHLTGFHLLD